tara:strand:- start:28749 stop:29852 length:1104 start_codon:yes stop_codon:yes gene_type:complete
MADAEDTQRSESDQVAKSNSPQATRFEYPLHNADDYKGKLRFTVLNEVYLKVSQAQIENLVGGAKKTLSDINKQAASSNNTVNGRFISSNGTVISRSGTALQASAADNMIDISTETRALEGINKSVTSDRLNITTDEVVLYMPAGIQFRDAVTYDNVDLGMTGSAIGAGASATAAFGGGLSSFVDGMTNSAMDANVASLVGRQALLKGIAEGLGGAGAGVAAGITAATGVVTNPNTRALFKQVNLREFSFTFKLVPRSAEEAAQIKSIINLFREELYPDDIPFDIAGHNVSVGYKFPNKFMIELEYEGKAIGHKIKPCFLRDVSTTYNASQMAFHNGVDGAEFMEADLTLTFQETETLSKKDVKKGF